MLHVDLKLHEEPIRLATETAKESSVQNLRGLRSPQAQREIPRGTPGRHPPLFRSSLSVPQNPALAGTSITRPAPTAQRPPSM